MRPTLNTLQSFTQHPGTRWARRCTLTALAFGLLFAAADVAALHWIDVGPVEEGAPGLELGSLLTGVLLTASAYALFGMLFGALTAPVSDRPALRRGAAMVLGALLAGALLTNLVSAVLCLHSGSYLTYGALQFTFNSFAHVSGAALAGHGVTLFAIGVFSAALWAGLSWLLCRPQSSHRVAKNPRWMTVSFSAPAFVAVVGFQGLGTKNYDHEVWRSTPELTLYSSFGQMMKALARVESRHRTMPLGPKLSTGPIWSSTAVTRETPPNVLLVMLESVSTRYLGYLGDGSGVTPELDRIAQRGLQLRRAWSTATHSNYAQMAVLSSLLPRRGRGLDTYDRLDYPRFLLHDALDRLGYQTATISSQDESWQGMSRFQTTATQTHFEDARSHQGAVVDIISEKIVPDHVTTEKAISWLAQQAGPWSLYVNFQATHFPYRLAPGVERPYQPDAPTEGQFNYLRYPEQDRSAAVNRYKNALHYVDAQLGRLHDYLERTGQLDNTLWVITSDHGEMFHEHGVVTHGRTLFEAEARVPLLLHWPKHLEADISQTPVSTLDVLPTILRAVGAPNHPAHQGASLVVEGEAAPSRRAVVLNIQGLRSVEGLVCWPHKLIVDVASGRGRLFDLASDPEEQHDLAKTQPERIAELAELLGGVMADQDAYHRRGDEERLQRYAPRVPNCPD